MLEWRTSTHRPPYFCGKLKNLNKLPATRIRFIRSALEGVPVTSEERENLDALCRHMQQENDPEEFQKLLIKLNHLLAAQ